MKSQEMKTALQDVRKAYRLLADYQTRIAELLKFIKDEFNAEHYDQYLSNYLEISRSARKMCDQIYNQESGWNFLPMMDMWVIWHKTKHIEDNGKWQNNIQEGDLLFSIRIASDEGKDGKLSVEKSTSELHIYIYKWIKYTRKNNVYYDVWIECEETEFNQVKRFSPNEDVECLVYGEKLNLENLFSEESVREALNALRKRASEALEQEI